MKAPKYKEKKIPEYNDKSKKSKKLKGLILFIILMAIVIAIIIFVPKLITLFNSLSGKDILIKVDVNKQNFYLVHGEKDSADFKITLKGSSLCRAECSYNFLDLSSNESVKEESFILGSIAQIKSFELEPKRLGKGQELYRLDLECKGVYSEVCQTSGRTSYRNILITVNYDLNDEEKSLKNDSLIRLNTLLGELETWHSEINYFDKALDELNKTSIIDDAIDKKAYLRELIQNLDGFIYDLRNSWNKQDHYTLNETIDQYSVFFSDFGQEFSIMNLSIHNEISEYNKIIDNLFLIKGMLGEMRTAIILNKTNFSQGKSVNETIITFNSLLNEIHKRDSIENKKILIEPILIKAMDLYIDFKNQSENYTYLPIGEYVLIDDVNLSKIEYNLTRFSLDISFDEPSEICCIMNRCKECCLQEACRNDASDYPIIFVHGHDISKYASAEYNLDAQNKIQNKLEQEGFANAGAISMSSVEQDQGVLGEMNAPMTFKISYYLDTKNDSSGYVEVQTKDESITDYSIRLKKLIDIVKYKTGRPKVVIIAYSMGGLVSRKYAQIYGEQDIYKMILIGTPNNGISGEIAELCPVIGGRRECEDMNADSSFIHELSKSKLTIPVYTIIGSGCRTMNGDGDGVVLVKSSRLEWANNTIVHGDCSGKVLHSKITDPALYPDAYNTILEVLKE